MLFLLGLWNNFSGGVFTKLVSGANGVIWAWEGTSKKQFLTPALGSGGLAQSLSISMDIWVNTLKTRATTQPGGSS